MSAALGAIRSRHPGERDCDHCRRNGAALFGHLVSSRYESSFSTLSSGFNGYRERATPPLREVAKVPRNPTMCAKAIFESFPGSTDFIRSVIEELNRQLEARFGKRG